MSETAGSLKREPLLEGAPAPGRKFRESFEPCNCRHFWASQACDRRRSQAGASFLRKSKRSLKRGPPLPQEEEEEEEHDDDDDETEEEEEGEEEEE